MQSADDDSGPFNSPRSKMTAGQKTGCFSCADKDNIIKSIQLPGSGPGRRKASGRRALGAIVRQCRSRVLSEAVERDSRVMKRTHFGSSCSLMVLKCFFFWAVNGEYSRNGWVGDKLLE